MRTTYERVPFDFEQAPTSWQRARRIIFHRQGNPGAEGESGIAWGKRTGAFTIHRYVDDTRCFEAIPLDRHAFHVKAASVAATRGYRTTGEYGTRGDYDSIGIEMEDESPQSAALAPGQAYGLSRETRITAVLVAVDILRACPWMTVEDIDEHATWDPADRPEDLGDALNVPDLREDVADVLAGRAPWRTVGEFARGTRAPASWKPATPQASTSSAVAEALRRLEAAQQEIAAGIAALKGA